MSETADAGGVLRRLLALALVVGAGFGVAPPSQAQAPGEALVEVCTELGLPAVPELGPRTCRSIAAGSTLFALVCQQLPVPAEACASLTDGVAVGAAEVDDFVNSWVARALRLQDRLDDDEPLRNTLWAHTHNSANSTAYPPSVANADPNQCLTILDQLRLGVRAVELDLHRFGGRVVLCHGRSEAIGPVVVHVGCSLDRPAVDGLAEVRAFLDQPGNEDEFVLLYLENQLDGDLAAHEEAAAAVRATLGDLVVPTPDGAPCAPMPLDTTVNSLRAAGYRVLVVGNCGPGSWGTLVHERGPDWDEGGDGPGFPTGAGCLDARAAGSFDDRWIRVYEDSTWLSAMLSGPTPPISADDVRAMVACGVDMVGFDRLVPSDGRLEAMVWSWAPGEPVDDPALGCAARGEDGRFRMRPCEEQRRFSCRTADGAWLVPVAAGPWGAGEGTCAAAGARFAAPPTGWENGRLAAAAGAGVEVWLPIGEAAAPAAPVAVPVAPAATGSGALPATGAPWPLLLAAVLVAAALSVDRVRDRIERRPVLEVEVAVALDEGADR